MRGSCPVRAGRAPNDAKGALDGIVRIDVPVSIRPEAKAFADDLLLDVDVRTAVLLGAVSLVVLLIGQISAIRRASGT